MYAEPVAPTCAAVSSSPAPASVRRGPIAPTMVTARPSRIHTVPSPTMTIQCHLDHGKRSMRAGMSVSIVRNVVVSAAIWRSPPTSRGTVRLAGYPLRTDPHELAVSTVTFSAGDAHRLRQLAAQRMRPALVAHGQR